MTSKCGKNEKQVESVTILLPQFHVITGQKHGRKVFFFSNRNYCDSFVLYIGCDDCFCFQVPGKMV